MNRRSFLQSILAAGVAPAFVGSGVLMPVRAIATPYTWLPGAAGNYFVTPPPPQFGSVAKWTAWVNGVLTFTHETAFGTVIDYQPKDGEHISLRAIQRGPNNEIIQDIQYMDAKASVSGVDVWTANAGLTLKP